MVVTLVPTEAQQERRISCRIVGTDVKQSCAEVALFVSIHHHISDVNKCRRSIRFRHASRAEGLLEAKSEAL
jgi:hypothetical protein